MTFSRRCLRLLHTSPHSVLAHLATFTGRDHPRHCAPGKRSAWLPRPNLRGDPRAGGIWVAALPVGDSPYRVSVTYGEDTTLRRPLPLPTLGEWTPISCRVMGAQRAHRAHRQQFNFWDGVATSMRSRWVPPASGDRFVPDVGVGMRWFESGTRWQLV